MMFSAYLSYLRLNHYAELHSPCLGTLDDPFTFDQVNTVYRDDHMITALYTLPESQPAISSKSDLKGFVSPQVYSYVLECFDATEEIKDSSPSGESFEEDCKAQGEEEEEPDSCAIVLGKGQENGRS
jgi:hypothetical protein